MNAQTLARPTAIFNLVSLTARLIDEPIQAESRDYGFDYDEAELAEALSAPLPQSLAQQGTAEVSAEEIESSCLYLF